MSFTVGGEETAYQPSGHNRFTIEQMIAPIQSMVHLSGLISHPPVYTFSMAYVPGIYGVKEEVDQSANDHAQRLLKQLTDLQVAEEALSGVSA